MPFRPLSLHRGTPPASPRRPSLRLRAALPAPATLLVLPLLLTPGARLAAQSATDGAISGRGPALSRVVARNNETGLEVRTWSTRDGFFLVPHLPPGDYTLDILPTEFAPFHRDHVLVTLGALNNLDPRSPASDTLQAAIPGSPSPPEPQVLADPEANPDSDAAGESLPTYRGLPATLNRTLLDGTDQTETFSGTPLGSGAPVDPEAEDNTADSETDTSATSRTSVASRSVRTAAVPFAFAHSAIREFRLTGQNYSALYGGAPGGILTAITRSGSSHLHGSAFLNTRTSGFDATNPYAIATRYTAGVVTSQAVKPDDSRFHFGGTLGGPLHRDRLFFFAAVEAERRNFPAISSPQDPNFYALTPTQRALLLNRGVSSSATAAALTYLDSLTGPTPRRADGEVLFARLDYHASAHILTSISYNNSRWNQPGGVLSAPVVSRARASLGNSHNDADAFDLRLTAYLTSSVTNEIRFGYSHSLQYQAAQTPLPQEPAIGPGNLPPEVAIGPQGLTFGTPANLGRTAYPDERRLQLVDLLSLTVGRHHIQLGTDLATAHTFVSALSNQQGTFRYDSASTTRGRAGGLVDFITDYTFNVRAYPNGACPSIYAPVHLFCFRSFTQSFGQQSVTFDTSQLAAYAQDDIRLRPTLTLNLGARFDYQLLPLPQQPNYAIDAIFSAQAATSIFPEDRNNFAPRIALAWRPAGGGTTIRAGYGIFFGRLPGATIRAALLNTDLTASTTHIRITPSTVTGCPQVANQGFGYPCAYLASPASALSSTASATLFARNFRLPQVQQGSITIEHQFPARINVEARYHVNLDRQLANSVDLNIAPSTTTATYQLQGGTGRPGVVDGETFALPLYTARRVSTLGPITEVNSGVNATYHGLILAARRSGPRLSFRATATFARAIDFGPTQGAIPRTNSQLDPYNLRYDKALSSLDFPFHLLADAELRPLFHTSHRTLRRVVNGWTVIPVFLRRSGAPYSLTLSGGPSLSGGSESLNGSGGALYLPTVGRNTMRLPAATTFDLRLSRSIRLRDAFTLHAIAEANNLANHVNISGVTQRAYLVGTPAAGITPLVFQDAATIAAEGVNTRPFGTFTDSGTSQARARTLQFGLRLEF